MLALDLLSTRDREAEMKTEMEPVTETEPVKEEMETAPVTETEQEMVAALWLGWSGKFWQPFGSTKARSRDGEEEQADRILI